MSNGLRIAVVVPAHNEARLIERTLASIPWFVDRIVVVDDGSDDETAARATDARDPRVVVVRHAQNRGVGAAIATGYEVAFSQGAEVAVVMAGDAQMDPDDLQALLAPIARGEADYAKGNRLAHHDVQRVMPRSRYLGNQLFSWLTRMTTGLEVQDSQCGYTAITREAAYAAGLVAMWPGYGYPNDALARLAQRGLRVRDVTVRPVYGCEQSGLGVRHAAVVVPYVVGRAWLRRWLPPLQRETSSSGTRPARLSADH